MLAEIDGAARRIWSASEKWRLSGGSRVRCPLPPSPALDGLLTGLSEPNIPVHRRERELPSPTPDRPRHPPGAQPAGHREREVREDLAVHRFGPHLAREAGRQVERDAAVHRPELHAVRPARLPHRRHDRPVHRRRLRVARRRDVNAAVHISTSGYAEATTVNGSIVAAMGKASWTDGVEFRSVNGGITLDLPPSLSGEVRAETVNGEIFTDFPLTVTGRLGPRRVTGTIGSGGRQLALSTVNGNIRLRKAG